MWDCWLGPWYTIDFACCRIFWLLFLIIWIVSAVLDQVTTVLPDYKIHKLQHSHKSVSSQTYWRIVRVIFSLHLKVTQVHYLSTQPLHGVPASYKNYELNLCSAAASLSVDWTCSNRWHPRLPASPCWIIWEWLGSKFSPLFVLFPAGKGTRLKFS